MSSSKVALYASVGSELAHYEVDVDGAALVKRAGVALPSNVQYAWPHPSRQYLYVASSPRGPHEGGAGAGGHYLTALRIDRATGALTPHGEPQPLRYRPIHMSLDATGRYALTAYNEPSSLSVHCINPDGTVGPPLEQGEALDTGIYAHQVLMTPSNRTVILVTRGNDAREGKAEDPGALKVFHFKDGMLSNLASIAPNRGFGFGPRHIDFHRSKPWVYVSLERENQLQMYKLEGDGLAGVASFTKDTLADPDTVIRRQMSGTVHVHPNGEFVHVANRADTTVDFDGKQVFKGGENNIAVFAIDQTTGEPTPIQHADPRAYHVRTFAFDSSGRMMVAASIRPLLVRQGTNIESVSAGLSVFRVARDGKLDFVRKYDVETGGKLQFWMGIVGL